MSSEGPSLGGSDMQDTHYGNVLSWSSGSAESTLSLLPLREL